MPSAACVSKRHRPAEATDDCKSEKSAAEAAGRLLERSQHRWQQEPAKPARSPDDSGRHADLANPLDDLAGPECRRQQFLEPGYDVRKRRLFTAELELAALGIVGDCPQRGSVSPAWMTPLGAVCILAK
jgi:hypothetical protein